MHAVSDEVAWVGGAEGTVLRTVDGGRTWQACAVPMGAAHLDFEGVQAFDAETAVVMSAGKGDLSRLYKTTDGCHTWELVLTNPDPEGIWQSMQFHWNPAQGSRAGFFSAGVLLGKPVDGQFPILTSKDYGTTWRSLQEDEAYSPGPSANADPGEALLAPGNVALTTVTEDNTFAFITGGAGGGRLLYPQGHREEFDAVSMRYSFADVRLPMPASIAIGAFAVGSRRIDPTHVEMMVVGGDPSQPAVGVAVLIRRSGLKRFLAPTASAAMRPPHGLRTSVAFDSASNTWIAVGPNGTDASRDDGRTWLALVPTEPTETDAGWQAISLPFVVGPGGRIGRLREGQAAKTTPVPVMETASLQVGTPKQGGTQPALPAAKENTPAAAMNP